MSKDTRIFGVIGLGKFGSALAQKLSQLGADVLAMDCDEEKVKDIRVFTDQAFVLNNMDIEALKETGVQGCDTAIVCVGEKIDVSILTALHLKQLGVPHIIAKATTDDQGTILTSLGAQVVYPERDMAARLAERLTARSILEYISLSDEVDISEMRLTDRAEGQSVRGLDLRGRFSLNVIAMVREDHTTIEIDPDAPLREGDVLAVVGKKENIARFGDFLTG